MKQHIENAKQWVKKHKKAVILTTGGVVAGIGALVFRNNFRIVSKNHDVISAAKDSEYMAVCTSSEAGLKLIDHFSTGWENSEHLNIDLVDVPLKELGEVGEVLAKEVNGDNNVEVLVTYIKK